MITSQALQNMPERSSQLSVLQLYYIACGDANNFQIQ
jgi:hypothetical protein